MNITTVLINRFDNNYTIEGTLNCDHEFLIYFVRAGSKRINFKLAGRLKGYLNDDRMLDEYDEIIPAMMCKFAVKEVEIRGVKFNVCLTCEFDDSDEKLTYEMLMDSLVKGLIKKCEN